MPRSSSALLSSTKRSATNFSTLILCVLILSALSFAAAPDRITAPILSSQLIKFSAGVPLKAQPQYDQGPVDPSFELSYMTLLTVPSTNQQNAISRLLAQQQDPRSPLYHKWLTPEQYADRFGLSSNDIQKITNWLQSQGFSILDVARGRNWIAFSGSAAQVQSTFQTEIHKYNVEGEMHFANSTPPSIPAALAGVVTGLRGLDDFRPRPTGILRNTRARPLYNSSLFGDLVAPGDISTIYDVNALYTVGIDGTGQKLAVAGQTDIYLADLTDFRTGFGLSAISCTVNSSGVITACNDPHFQYVLGGLDPGVSPGDLSESDLDIEWSGAVAKNAQIIFVTSTNAFTSYYYAIDHQLAPVISLSYGLCELQDEGFVAADEAELQKGNSLGITIVNSSGDTGVAACDPNGSTLSTAGLAVSYPASSPEVTGVGGSAVPLANFTSTYWGTTNGTDGGTALSYIPEIAWNDDAEFAAFCATHSTNTFCSTGNGTGVAITSEATAQNAIGIQSGGGGASNCSTTNGSGICTGGFPQPSWQTVTISGQAGARFSPDVSSLASANFPGYIFCTELSELGDAGTGSSCAPGGATGITNALALTNASGSPTPPIIGGTSVSAPVFAGILALINQYLVTNGFQSAAGLGNANPDLYHVATYNPVGFHQVTTGDNMVYCQPGSPAAQPAALRCPAAIPPATEGVFGYQASNADSVTGYNLVTGLGSVKASSLATAWGELLTASTTSLSPSATQIIPGGSETFTITVTPSTASGVVSLYDNGSTTALGTATVSGGTGTFTTTALQSVGPHSIIGKYIGTNAASTSAPVIITVTAPTFNLSTPTTPATALSGQSTTSTFTVTPTGGAAKFAANVTFACNGIPDATVTCNFSTNPILAGASATNETLTIKTVGPNSGTLSPQQRRAENRSPWLPLTLPLAGIVMVGFAGRKMSKHSAIAGLCVSLALLGLLVACGSSNPPVTISVSPTAATVFASGPAGDGWPPQTATFTPMVAHTSNTAVNWSLTSSVSCTGVPSPCGSIPGGVYTAPIAAVGLPGSVTVTATSQADITKTATATVTITPTTVPGSYPLTVTATEDTTQNTTSSFTLTVK